MKAWNKGLQATKDERVRKGIEKRREVVLRKGTYKGNKNPRWISGHSIYKKMALEYYGKCCMDCGIYHEESHMMAVHHKDENRENNKIENLEVLCTRCHHKKHPHIVTEEQKHKISNTLKGRKFRPETLERMSKARKEWWKRHPDYIKPKR